MENIYGEKMLNCSIYMPLEMTFPIPLPSVIYSKEEAGNCTAMSWHSLLGRCPIHKDFWLPANEVYKYVWVSFYFFFIQIL